jgi:hypothetical protein
MRRLIITIVVVVLFAVVGLCGSVLAVGVHLSAPRFAVIGKPPAELSNAETVEILSESGTTLRGWWIAGRTAVRSS